MLDNQGSLTAQNGAVTVSSTAGLTVTGATGTMTGNAITLASGLGALSAEQLQYNGTVSASGRGISIVSGSGVTFGNVTSGSGDITLEARAGALNVAAGATISGLNGDINLFNTAAAGGTIAFGSGAKVDLTTSSSVGGAIRVIVDTNPLAAPLITGTTPAGFSETTVNGGTVYWGPANVVGSSLPGNTATSIGGAIVFYGTNANEISADGSVAFRVETPAIIVNSLDLFDQTVVNSIVTLQGQGKLGGSLSWNGTQGVGDVIITGDNVSPVGFIAVRIPDTATVTGHDFPNSKPFLVSSLVQVDINGTIEFTTANSNPQFNSNQGIVISFGGNLYSLTDLTVNAPFLTNNGTVRADSGNIAVIGSNGLIIGGTGSYLTAGTTSFTATTGDLVVNNSANIVNSAVLATASPLGAVQIAPAVNFAANGDLTVNTATLINNGVLRSINGNLTVGGANGITLSTPGTLSAIAPGKTVTINGGTGDVNLPSSMTVTGFADINAASGRVNVGAGVTISATQDLSIDTPILNNLGTVNPTGLLTITGVNGLSVVGNGTLNTPTNITLNGGGGSVVSTQNQILQAVNANGTSVTITTPSGDLTVGNITATAGSAQLTSSAGNVHVLAARNLNVNGGDLILRTDNLAANIIVDDSVKMNVTSNSSITGGRIILTFGAQTEPPVMGAAPVDPLWSASQTKGGNIFYGAGLSFTGGVGSPVSKADIEGGVLIFNGATPGSIQIDENVLFNVDGVAPALSNLDLTNPTVAQPIQTAQKEGRLLGFLNLNGSGQATGGNVILLPVNYNLTGLSAVNIVSGVTVTNRGFTAADQVNIVSPTTALINGAFEFVDANLQARITSNNLIQVGGSLASVGGLTVNAPGLINSGTVSVAGAAAGSVDLNLNIASLTNSGSLVSTNGSVNVSNGGLLTVTGGGNISATTAGQFVNITSTGNKVLFSGSQSIVGSATVNGPQVEVQGAASLQASANLTVNTASLNNAGSISTDFGALTVQSGGALNITGATGSLAGASGTTLTAVGALNVNQAALADGFDTSGASVSVTTGGGMTIGDVTASNGNAAFTSNTGMLRVGAGAVVNVNNGDFLLQNNNALAGTVAIGTGADVNITTASSSTGGRMVVTIGNVAQPPLVGTAPGSGWLAASSNGGHIFYGANSPSTGASTGNTAQVNGGVLIFNNPDALRPNAISLEGNVDITINGKAPTLTSLDLTSGAVTGGILTCRIKVACSVNWSPAQAA